MANSKHFAAGAHEAEADCHADPEQELAECAGVLRADRALQPSTPAAVLFVLRVVGRLLARCCSSSSDEEEAEVNVRPSRLTFKPSVSCYEVPDLGELDTESKRKLWWSSDDYGEFLKTHVEIAKAYERSVEQDQVDSFSRDPALSNDSRRGLGLGRGPTRAQNAQEYFNAVLAEQARQALLGIVDDEALSVVAREASSSEVQYAISNAARDAEDARRYRPQPGSAMRKVPSAIDTSSPWLDEPAPLLAGMKKVNSLQLMVPQESDDDDDDDDDDDACGPQPRHARSEPSFRAPSSTTSTPKVSKDDSSRRDQTKDQCRGYGLTADQLLEAGFLPSGRLGDAGRSPHGGSPDDPLSPQTPTPRSRRRKSTV